MNSLSLKNIALNITDGEHGTVKDDIEGKYFYLSNKNIIDNNVIYDKNDRKISKDIFEKINKRIKLEKDDLLLSTVGTIGKTTIVKEQPNYTFQRSVGIIKINKKLANPYYIKYYLDTPTIQKNLNQIANGGVQKGLYISDLENLKIDIPSIQIQEKIANTLKILDDKIDINNKIINESEKLAKKIYDYWFKQFEFPDKNGNPYKSSNGKMIYNEKLKKDIPIGWEYKTVEDFCTIFTGKKDVNQAKDYGKYKFYSCSPNYKFSNDLLYEGKAILISGNGSYTGRTIFINDAFDLYQRTYACVEKNKNNILTYVYYSMLSFFVPVVSGGTHGSAIPYIIYDDIAKHGILYNQDIVKKFVGKINPVQDNIIKLNKENEELTNLKNYLLPLLMNGQVSFKD